MQVKAPAAACDLQSAMCAALQAVILCRLHSTALLWIHLRMAADSVQWTSKTGV